MKEKINRIIISVLIIMIISVTYIALDTYKQNSKYENEIMRLEEEINKLKANNSIQVDNSKDSNLPSSVENNSRLIKVSLEELENMVKNKESFMLVLTQTNCSHCISYKPTLVEVLEDTAQIAYEIDIQPLSLDEKERVYKIARVSGTPTTVFISEGEEKDTSLRLIGSVSSSKLKERLKETGYIK